LRGLGIEDDIHAQARPHELMGETVFCTSLVGDEIGRVRATVGLGRRGNRLLGPVSAEDLPRRTG